MRRGRYAGAPPPSRNAVRGGPGGGRWGAGDRFVVAEAGGVARGGLIVDRLRCDRGGRRRWRRGGAAAVCAGGRDGRRGGARSALLRQKLAADFAVRERCAMQVEIQVAGLQRGELVRRQRARADPDSAVGGGLRKRQDDRAADAGGGLMDVRDSAGDAGTDHRRRHCARGRIDQQRARAACGAGISRHFLRAGQRAEKGGGRCRARRGGGGRRAAGLQRLRGDLAADFAVGECRAMHIEVIVAGVKEVELRFGQRDPGGPDAAVRRGLRQRENDRAADTGRGFMNMGDGAGDAGSRYGCHQFAGGRVDHCGAGAGCGARIRRHFLCAGKRGRKRTDRLLRRRRLLAGRLRSGRRVGRRIVVERAGRAVVVAAAAAGGQHDGGSGRGQPCAVMQGRAEPGQ